MSFLQFYSAFIVLCGKTGSGKTLLLQQLESSGYPVLNLEKIARHRGSSFGGFLLPAQPSQNDFEDTIQQALISCADTPYIFVEQKAGSLGKRKIPLLLFNKMQEGISIQLNAGKKQRVQHIVSQYKAAGSNNFLAALHQLKDRLPENTIKQCEAFIFEENYEAFVEAMLNYYDSSLKYNLYKEPAIIITPEINEPFCTMSQLLDALKEKGIIVLPMKK